MHKIKSVQLAGAAFLLCAGMLFGQTAANAPTTPTPAGVQTPRAATPVPKTENPNWMPQHEANVAQSRKGGIDVLFVGDSITKCWVRDGREVWNARFVPMRAGNIGISGDCTQHVLWRLQNGELENLTPKLVVLLIGTNNITAHDSPADITQAVAGIISEIRQRLPKARILLLGILPRRELAKDPDREIVRSVNSLLSQLQDGDRITYLDIGDKFLMPDGSMNKEATPDFVHLTAKGYEIFADAIQPTVESLISKP